MISRVGMPRAHRTPAVDRVLEKCSVVDECWVFGGSRNDCGYGLVGTATGTQRAHRVVFEFFIDSIPAGLVLDHLCRNPPCVNPWHCEPVPQRVNLQRAHRPLKTECIRGHPFDEENTKIGTGGKRVCRTCARDYLREYHQARRRAS